MNKFQRAFIGAGHKFKMTDPSEMYDGISKPDMFAWSIDIHNGPECVTCGWYCCEHCIDIDKIPSCKGFK